MSLSCTKTPRMAQHIDIALHSLRHRNRHHGAKYGLCKLFNRKVQNPSEVDMARCDRTHPRNVVDVNVAAQVLRQVNDRLTLNPAVRARLCKRW